MIAARRLARGRRPFPWPGLVAALLVCAGLGAAATASAQGRPPVVITDPSDKTYRVALQRFYVPSPGAEEHAARIRESVESGLAFSGLFTEIDPKAFLEPFQGRPVDDRAPTVCPNWRQIGADALVESELHREGEAMRIEFKVLDVSRGCLRLLRKRYRGDTGDAARMGRAMADDIVGAFTGQPGVSDTEIAFVSDRSGNKEIYVMGADGSGLRSATSNRSINSFPSWSPSGDAIVYTSYRYRNRPGLFLLTRGRSSPGRILRDLDSGAPVYRAVFDPSGERMAVVMSVDGATEIFTVARGGSGLRRLTRDRGIDIGPSFSPDGRHIAFASDRTGSPQIYVMDSDGSDVRRLTFNGSYNTSPAWSPDGRWIAYESRVGGQFDIWLVDPDGRTNVPLITHPRSDEHPTWSPDGRHLAFSSTRRGRADIYVSDVTGGNLRRLTDRGENTTPHWGPYRR